MENCYHAALEGSRCVAQPKRHTPVGECTERTGERGLFLVLRSDRNLKITREPVQKAIIHLPRQSFQHLIDEWKQEVILAGGVIEFEIIDANSPSGDGSGRNKFILIICDHSHSSFLG